jgi:phage baseplate assembly protein W
MPSVPTLSSFTALVGTQLWDLGGDFQFDFNATAGSVEEVLQNIYNTFQTRLGMQRLQRSFGLDMSWIDMPGNIATLQGQIAVLKHCSYWEPRATFRKIQFTLDPVSVLAGVYSLYVELDIDLDLQINQILYAPPSDELVWVIDGPLDGVTLPSVSQKSLTL